MSISNVILMKDIFKSDGMKMSEGQNTSVKRMATLQQTRLSEVLYEYLSEVIGSERKVLARRTFFKVVEEILSHRPLTTIISSGSKAEGLDMRGSDIDMMIICDILPVFHDIHEVNNAIGFITHFEHSPPGFVLLTGVSGNNDLHIFTHTEYGAVLSNEKFKNFFLRSSQRSYEDLTEIHGPCVVPKTVDIDIAYCLRSEGWPQIAQRWFERAKNSEWPPSYVVSKMADSGLLYVPIGSKFGSNESNPLEWRISFSIQEKLLIHSFTHTQLLCYAMLKIVLKEIINKNKDTEQLLCSYFLKTTIFWISEECSITKWRPECLFSCFQSCLERLVYWVKLGYCPNYFIPEHNMFEGKIYGRSQNVLLAFLERLLSLGPKIIYQSPTLAKFNKKCVVDASPNEDIDGAIYPLLHIYFKFVSLEIHPRRYLPLLITKINRASKNGLTKSLYLRWLVYFSVQLLTEIPFVTKCSNKLFYQQYKTCRFYCLLGKNTDIVSGWLWLAAFFYHQGEYYKAIDVINNILDECTPDKIFISDSESLVFEHIIDAPTKLSFLERHKLSCIYQLYKVPRIHTLFYNSDLNATEYEQGIASPPIVFIHFLRVMCYHRLGNKFERNKCLEDMESTIVEDFFVGSSELRTFAYMNLLRAFQLTQNTHRAEEIEDKISFEIMKQPKIAEMMQQMLVSLNLV